MIGHYLASALGKFRKSPFTTAANVLTLALGLVCFIAAWGVATYWRSADHYHPNAERTFVVGKSVTYPGDDASSSTGALSAGVLARHLTEYFPEIESIARATGGERLSVTASGNNTQLSVAHVDPAFLDFFDFGFVAGDPANALDNPGSAVLTQEAAERLFGVAPALGQTLNIPGRGDVTVTGVIAPVRQPSFMGSGPDSILRFDMLADWGTNPGAAFSESSEAWVSSLGYTFVTLPSARSAKAFNERLPSFVEARVPADARDSVEISYKAFPVAQLVTATMDEAFFAQSGLELSTSVALLGLGLLILAVSCVNYANLATAQASDRAKEVGLRSLLGAGRRQIMTQSWLEAGLTTLAAMAVAIGVLALVAPAARSSTGVDVLAFLSLSVVPISVLSAFAVLVALAAGAYPALVLSRMRPGEALRVGQSRSAPRFVARLLVGVQFASASFLLILIVTTQLQRAELERLGLGPRENPIVTLNPLAGLGADFETLRAELTRDPRVLNVTRADMAPWSPASNVMEFTHTPDAAESAPSSFVRHVDYNFFETLSLDVLAGRTFDPARDQVPVNLWVGDASQTLPAVVDHLFLERMGFDSPQAAIDSIIYLPSQGVARRGRPAQPLRIIGVTERDTLRVDAREAAGYLYVYGPESFGQYPIIEISRDDVAGTVASITETWDRLLPDVPVNIAFFDELFESSFRSFARVNQVFMLLGSTAFVIASVGLVGIAVNVTARRRHEIGVRKTLGAPTMRILRMLIADFSKPVMVGNMIAWPFAWMAAQIYLQGFATRTPLTPLPFVLSLAFTLLVAWLAVGGQAWKAARVKPALVLKAE